MKVALSFLAVIASASAFVSQPSESQLSRSSASTSLGSFLSPKDLPGVVAPLGFFDPLGFSSRADLDTLKRYREAEITHGRVAMLAVIGVIAGEAAASPKSILFGVSGPAVDHFSQVPVPFWAGLAFVIANAELIRAQIGFVEPDNVPIDKPGLMRDSYNPGDLGFDPLNLRPTTAQGYKVMQTKELQNGRLAMIAFAGMMAQEQVNGRQLFDNLFG